MLTKNMPGAEKTDERIRLLNEQAKALVLAGKRDEAYPLYRQVVELSHNEGIESLRARFNLYRYYYETKKDNIKAFKEIQEFPSYSDAYDRPENKEVINYIRFNIMLMGQNIEGSGDKDISPLSTESAFQILDIAIRRLFKDNKSLIYYSQHDYQDGLEKLFKK